LEQIKDLAHAVADDTCHLADLLQGAYSAGIEHRPA